MKRRSFISICLGTAAACVGLRCVESNASGRTINDFRQDVLRLEPVPWGNRASAEVDEAYDIHERIATEYGKRLMTYLDETLCR